MDFSIDPILLQHYGLGVDSAINGNGYHESSWEQRAADKPAAIGGPIV
jgi:hypothetical protein